MTKKQERTTQDAKDTPSDKTGNKGVRWSSEVSDNQKQKSKKKPPPPPALQPNVARLHPNDAASEQLARALNAQNPPATREARIKLENDWELTWPIWHMLPWMERKEIAQRHGYQTIGAFEEYMSLQKALDDEGAAGAAGVAGAVPYANELAYPKKVEEDDDSKPSAVDEDADEEDDSDTEEDDKLTTNSDTETEEEEEVESDSMLLTLPDEILHTMFSFLPVTLYGTKLAYVSMHPHWRRAIGSDAVMKQLCERVYLQQSKKKQLRVSKFHHSYRFMLYQRPRVQAGGGVYVLRFGRVKPIQRDMWTEVPVGAILETVYYRYLYFEEHGHCLYALSTIPPHDMLKRFHRVLLQSSHENPEAAMFDTPVGGKRKPPRKLKGKEKETRAAELDTRVVWGTYTIQRDRLTVTAKQSWQTVQFGLRINTHHNRPYEEHKHLHHHHHHFKEKETAGDKKLPAKGKPKASAASAASAADVRNLKSSEEDYYVNGSDAYTTSPHGRFGVLQLETHRSSISGNFDEHDVTFMEQIGGVQHPQVYHHSDVVNYNVEVDQVFRFLPDPRF